MAVCCSIGSDGDEEEAEEEAEEEDNVDVWRLGATTTMAATFWPHTSDGTPTTAASAMPGLRKIFGAHKTCNGP